MTQVSFETVKYQADDGVAVITLHRPERMNAFTSQMAADIIAAFDESDRDDDVRCVILTGEGRAFCAGADLGTGGDTFARTEGADFMRDQYKVGDVYRDLGGVVSLRIYRSLKPVIAAINGAAVGVGITMTLPCDIRLAAEGAKIGFVFARRGIVPEACSSWFLPRLVGISTALEWSLSGRILTAEAACAGGLVRSVHPAGELMAAATGLAREIADNAAPVSAAATRQMMWRMLSAAHPMAAHGADSRAMMSRGGSADAREGVQSFLEKRPAAFPDRVSGGLPPMWTDWEEPEFS